MLNFSKSARELLNYDVTELVISVVSYNKDGQVFINLQTNCVPSLYEIQYIIISYKLRS